MKYLKLLLLSVCCIVIIAALSIVYGFIVHRFFTLRYIFDANFLVGAFIIIVGIALMFLPTDLFLKTETLLERFSFVERRFDNRERRQQKARIVLWLGIYNMLLAGLIQLLLSLIL